MAIPCLARLLEAIAGTPRRSAQLVNKQYTGQNRNLGAFTAFCVSLGGVTQIEIRQSVRIAYCASWLARMPLENQKRACQLTKLALQAHVLADAALEPPLGGIGAFGVSVEPSKRNSKFAI